MLAQAVVARLFWEAPEFLLTLHMSLFGLTRK
jgi:hypothetical protein